jgi:hypothetical protein
MEFKDLDILITEKTEMYHQNEKEINDLRKLLDENLDKMKVKFFEVAKKLDPLIEKYKEDGFYFKHDEYKIASTRGPIVGFNQLDNILYVYTGGEGFITKVDLNNDEIKRVAFWKFLEKNSFDTAITGLYNVLKLQDMIKDDYQKQIERCNKELDNVKNYF